jgi:enamine deaminase RidA (YjgF/YER057c/UK114 family)
VSAARLRTALGAGILAGVCAFLLAVPDQAAAQARSAETVLMAVNPQARADQERYGYADAVVAGDLVFLSGLVAGRAPGESNLVPAYERLFRHAARILERAGSSLADVVDVTSFHTDITAEIETLSEVQKRMLGSPPPAWTAIDVDRLLPDQGVTEIKLVARRSAPARAATANP